MMKNYLKQYGAYSFRDVPFNEVDNVLFSLIAYLPLERVGLGKKQEEMSLEEAVKTFFEVVSKEEIASYWGTLHDTALLFETMGNCPRYQSVRLSHYVKERDAKKQFGALCLEYLPRHVYVSYQGTDTSIIGWKEDFQMLYMFPIPSQVRAVEYLKEAVDPFHVTDLRVGGHSKGGNLAMCAVMYAPFLYRVRLRQVYNNDGPSFRKREVTSHRFARMKKKLVMILPEESVVGLLLHTPDNYHVVKSTARHLNQHNPGTWRCFGPSFVRGTLSKVSKEQNETMDEWLLQYNDRERKKMVLAFFQILSKAGATEFPDLSHVKWKDVVSLIKGVRDLDSAERSFLLSALGSLFQVGLSRVVSKKKSSLKQDPPKVSSTR